MLSCDNFAGGSIIFEVLTDHLLRSAAIVRRVRTSLESHQYQTCGYVSHTLAARSALLVPATILVNASVLRHCEKWALQNTGAGSVDLRRYLFLQWAVESRGRAFK